MALSDGAVLSRCWIEVCRAGNCLDPVVGDGEQEGADFWGRVCKTTATATVGDY